MKRELPRLMIAAPQSGGGKTTLACGLLWLLKKMGYSPAAFKCGPDYVDPLFHRRVVGAKSGNLDLFFTGEDTARALLHEGAAGCKIALLEGVMGYYDGLGPGSAEASSYHVARATQTPVLFVLDARGAALSLAAQIHGFSTFREDANIQGVILNKCGKALHDHLAPALRQATGIPVLGYLPRQEEFSLPSRHLGLVPAAEIPGLQATLEQLAQTLRGTLDVQTLLRIAKGAPPLQGGGQARAAAPAGGPRIAVAQDEAFCFYYQENLRMLEKLGAVPVPFSPLHDEKLPGGVAGLYLGGGYPELHARQLAENTRMLASLREAAGRDIPLVAEGGGFIYLQQELEDINGASRKMLGVLPGKSKNAGTLKQFGYVTLTAQQDNLYCPRGESIPAHEFHYWHSTRPGDAFCAAKPDKNKSWSAMAARGNMVAGFPHLYYPARPGFAKRLVQAAAACQSAQAER